jgi:hypothetical protein
VAEIRNGPEEPDRENRSEPTPDDDTGAARERIEPRSRAEYSADLERHAALAGFESRVGPACPTSAPQTPRHTSTSTTWNVPGCQWPATARAGPVKTPDDEIRVFRTELREALADPGQLPDNELFKAVQFSDGSNEAFLRRLWHDLYGDEP